MSSRLMGDGCGFAWRFQFGAFLSAEPGALTYIASGPQCTVCGRE